ncbi:hypothetical protein [Bacillus sp. TH13]|uniref:hypothetical protein n=1 Tax=Bacillus sp. TH13 TaxID=2796379 RepID=UPI0019145BEC|nr:hypothetical protein [Bacillus sp. TH13]MBK5491849.1 hypothetical protein [Bacillus sp. TH13]
MSVEISTLLTRYYVKLGMTAEEYIILNSYLNQSNINYGKQNLTAIAEMTDKSQDEVETIFHSLFHKKIISKDPIHNTIDIWKLHHKLINIQNDIVTINSLITQSIENYYNPSSNSSTQHFGQVTLLPLNEGGITITQGTQSMHGGLMWSKQNIEKLAKELLQFVERIDQDWINQYNEKIKKTKHIYNNLSIIKNENKQI